MSKRSKHQSANAIAFNLVHWHNIHGYQHMSKIRRKRIKRLAFEILGDRKYDRETKNFKSSFVKIRALRSLENGGHVSTFIKVAVSEGRPVLPYDTVSTFGLPHHSYKRICGID